MKTLRLFSNQSDSVFGNSEMDIRFDVSGNPIFIDKEDALDQSVAKALLTEQQDDGYGSLLSSLIGSKERISASAMLILTVSRSLQLLKQIQVAWRNRNAFVNTREIVYTVDAIRVVPVKQKISVSVAYRSLFNADVQREVSV